MNGEGDRKCIRIKVDLIVLRSFIIDTDFDREKVFG